MGGPGSGRRASPETYRHTCAMRLSPQAADYLGRMRSWREYVETTIEQRRAQLRMALRMLEEMPAAEIVRRAGEYQAQPVQHLSQAEALRIIAAELDAGNSVLARLLAGTEGET